MGPVGKEIQIKICRNILKACGTLLRTEQRVGPTLYSCGQNKVPVFFSSLTVWYLSTVITHTDYYLLDMGVIM